MFKSIDYFETQRFFARKLTVDDLDKFVLLNSNEKVMHFLGGACSLEEATKKFHWNLQQWETNHFGLWIFYIKNTGEWIGHAGLRRVEKDTQTEIEVAYALLPEFWKQGFATEITKACIEIAFEILHFENIVCVTQSKNKASLRVMEKTGFQFEKFFLEFDEEQVLYRLCDFMQKYTSENRQR